MGKWPNSVWVLEPVGGSSREEGASRKWPSKDEQELPKSWLKVKEEATMVGSWTVRPCGVREERVTRRRRKWWTVPFPQSSFKDSSLLFDVSIISQHALWNVWGEIKLQWNTWALQTGANMLRSKGARLRTSEADLFWRAWSEMYLLTAKRGSGN